MTTTGGPSPTAEDATKALILSAMMSAIDQKTRDNLIAKALETLIAPSSEGAYGRKAGPSRLEQAFAYAVEEMARKIVDEMIDTEEVRQRIRDIATVAFEKMATDKDQIATRMAEAMIQAMTKRDY